MATGEGIIGAYHYLSEIMGAFQENVVNNMLEAAQAIYNNSWFEASFLVIIIIYAFQVMQGGFTREGVLRLINILLMAILVKAIIWNRELFFLFLGVMQLPADIFASAVSFVVGGELESEPHIILDQLQTVLGDVGGVILDNVGWTVSNVFSAIFAMIIFWLVSLALVLVIIFMLLVSKMISIVALGLAPILLPFLLFKATRGMFFGWMKFYISYSLYGPFTIFFGYLLAEISTLAIQTKADMTSSFDLGNLFALIIAEVIIGIVIWKIPQFVNQIIGTQNDSGSLVGAINGIAASVSASRAATQGGWQVGKAARDSWLKAKEHSSSKIKSS
ncbi:type IV secretion system protein [Wolinella succinogenes]|nr:type IV secretion system protein [Wolinella succinogenes]VEG82405.1 Type IV secretory pathway, TrbL components [Wolinella succinogenes]